MGIPCADRISVPRILHRQSLWCMAGLLSAQGPAACLGRRQMHRRRINLAFMEMRRMESAYLQIPRFVAKMTTGARVDSKALLRKVKHSISSMWTYIHA